MVSKKQKFLTVILVIVLAIVIVGGVFGISFVKGRVTFPWQLQNSEAKTEQVKEPAKEEPKLVIKEKKQDESAKKEQELKKAKEEAEAAVEKETEKTEEEPVDNLLNDMKLKYYGKLAVEGSHLVDADGHEVLLMGVSTHGINWYPEYASAETIKSLRDTWGINVIRLAMYTSDYNGYCVAGKENQEKLKDIIDDAVEAATDNDMYVIIDWHTLNDADPNEYKADAIQFFGEMVRKYKDNENVIYEICNEPNGDTTWNDVRRYANEVIPVIRNVDAIILVGTPKWATDLDSVLDKPLDFDNIMYTYHFYAGTHHKAERNALRDALDEGLPVFISEYGLVDADGDGNLNEKEADYWYDMIRKEYGVSSCMWNLSNKDEGSAMINADCDKLSDFTEEDLSESAMWLIDQISQLKHSDLEQGVDWITPENNNR
uniref:Endoglucanase A n=1 Tax=Butyrivibrio fibrisolvens TaxID=831 RepID=GUNA_BUTFI